MSHIPLRSATTNYIPPRTLFILALLFCVVKSLMLTGQRVLVTGAGRGIGRAIAAVCHKHGAKVAITSRTDSELRETEALLLEDVNGRENELSDRIFVKSSDVTKDDQVEELIEAIVQKWGGIDVLINNAGKGQHHKSPVYELESKELESILDLNVVAAHRVTSQVVKKCMKPQENGTIVNISSKAGKVGLPDYSFYVASKFALEGLTASWAMELKSFGISVNSISPGMVNTKSFPKPPDREGVRPAESIEDGLLLILQSPNKTGHYLHVDELDEVRRRGLPDSLALKEINEPNFVDTLPSE